MTVEELNIKISADAENFKREIAAANQAMTIFRSNCINAGHDATAAFNGLVTAEVSAVQTDKTAENKTAAVTAETDNVQSGSGSDSVEKTITPVGIPSTVPPEAYAASSLRSTSTGTAVLPALAPEETVIGAVSETANDSSPVNITTTVELDGDKVGESVNRFNLRRNTITNGMYG